MQWGQFIANDLSYTPVRKMGKLYFLYELMIESLESLCELRDAGFLALKEQIQGFLKFVEIENTAISIESINFKICRD